MKKGIRVEILKEWSTPFEKCNLQMLSTLFVDLILMLIN